MLVLLLAALTFFLDQDMNTSFRTAQRKATVVQGHVGELQTRCESSGALCDQVTQRYHPVKTCTIGLECSVCSEPGGFCLVNLLPTLSVHALSTIFLSCMSDSARCYWRPSLQF